MLVGNDKQQRGFSLIEVLIALVILSIGLIGVAAMQLKALQSANVGYQRSVASVAAVDAQERFWAQLAMIGPNQTCDDINVSAVEAAWKSHWLQDQDTHPLRGAQSGLTVIEKIPELNHCHFRVNVALGNDGEDHFDYLFRLPRIEPSP